MKYAIAVGVMMVVGLLYVDSAQATGTLFVIDPDASVTLEKKFVQNIGSIAVIDLGKDGLKEFAIGSPVGQKPKVTIVRQDGTEVFSFYPYTDRQSEGAQVAIGDIDNDKKPEIITLPGLGRSQVKIFDTYGKQKLGKSFFAFDRNQIGEHKIALANLTAGSGLNIIVYTGRGLLPQMKAFTSKGKAVAFSVVLKDFGITGLAVVSLPSDTTKHNNVLITEQYGMKRQAVLVDYKGKSIRTFALDWVAGVIDIAVDETAGKEEPNILLLESGIPEPMLARFDETGKQYSSVVIDTLKNKDFAYHLSIASLRGEIFPQVLVTQSNIPSINMIEQEQHISISLESQRLRFHDRGFEAAFIPVSSGRPSSPTPPGIYSIANHFLRPYSRKANLYMPYWMAFKAPEYGLHELPEWANGAKEGAEHLGLKVSHGCVRLPVGAAQAIWTTAQDGAVVEIL